MLRITKEVNHTTLKCFTSTTQIKEMLPFAEFCSFTSERKIAHANSYTAYPVNHCQVHSHVENPSGEVNSLRNVA